MPNTVPSVFEGTREPQYCRCNFVLPTDSKANPVRRRSLTSTFNTWLSAVLRKSDRVPGDLPSLSSLLTMMANLASVPIITARSTSYSFASRGPWPPASVIGINWGLLASFPWPTSPPRTGKLLFTLTPSSGPHYSSPVTARIALVRCRACL